MSLFQPKSKKKKKPSLQSTVQKVRMQEQRESMAPTFIFKRTIIKVVDGQGRFRYYDAKTGEKVSASHKEATGVLKFSPAGETAAKKGVGLADLLQRGQVTYSGDLKAIVTLGSKRTLTALVAFS
ncbi:hypothetical protein LCGC14_0146870 [marine sediment metagenome]|uniref:SCP2 domain-containing protein n=1 Tax=marine sediment metagenome TaxID=412755 RepID=A0A0F9V029_9ZZZZ